MPNIEALSMCVCKLRRKRFKNKYDEDPWIQTTFTQVLDHKMSDYCLVEQVESRQLFPFSVKITINWLCTNSQCLKIK